MRHEAHLLVEHEPNPDDERSHAIESLTDSFGVLTEKRAYLMALLAEKGNSSLGSVRSVQVAHVAQVVAKIEEIYQAGRWISENGDWKALNALRQLYSKKRQIEGRLASLMGSDDSTLHDEIEDCDRKILTLENSLGALLEHA